LTRTRNLKPRIPEPQTPDPGTSNPGSRNLKPGPRNPGGAPAQSVNGRERAAERAMMTASMADHYHSASEHGIIGRQIETIVAGRFCRRRLGLWRTQGLGGHRRTELDQTELSWAGQGHTGRGAWSAEEGDGRMAAMKPRTGDGPLEVTKEGRGIVMRVPLEGGGRLVVELTADEAAKLGDALKSVVG
jgi:Protein of unknown function (DUF3117)